jgi:hypothetical protein
LNRKDLDTKYHSYLTLEFKDGTRRRIRMPIFTGELSVKDGLLRAPTHHGFDEMVGELTVPVDNLRYWSSRWEAQDVDVTESVCPDPGL